MGSGSILEVVAAGLAHRLVTEDKGRRDIKDSVVCLHRTLLALPCWWSLRSSLILPAHRGLSSQHSYAHILDELSVEGSRASAFQVVGTIRTKAGASPTPGSAHARM